MVTITENFVCNVFISVLVFFHFIIKYIIRLFLPFLKIFATIFMAIPIFICIILLYCASLLIHIDYLRIILTSISVHFLKALLYFYFRLKEAYYASCIFWFNAIYSIIYFAITVSPCLLLILALQNQKNIIFGVFIGFMKLYTFLCFALFFIYLAVWIFAITMGTLSRMLDTFYWYYCQLGYTSYYDQSIFNKVVSNLNLPITTVKKFFKINILDLNISVEFKKSTKFLYINLDKILKANMYLAFPSSLFGLVSGLLITMVYIQYPNIISRI